MIGKAFPEPALQPFALLAHVFQQMLLDDRLLNGERRGACHGVAHIGVAVLEIAAPIPKCSEHLLGEQHSADRLIART